MEKDLISSWMPLVLALMSGFAAAALGTYIMLGVSNAPSEDREFKDPLPIGVRIVWPGVRWIAPAMSIVMPEDRAGKIDQSLRKAGLEFTLDASQYLAVRVLSAIMFSAGFAALVAFMAPLLKIASLPLWAPWSAGALLGWFYPRFWLRDREALRRAELRKALPFFLDIITLCVEAGLNLPGALKQAVDKGPKGVLRNEFIRVLRDIRAGAARAEALRSMADRLAEPDVTHFVTATILAEGMGASLGPVLRAQADQRRSERFTRAEKLAMQAPVKMLLPLTLCIFPCTMIVILMPIAVKFLMAGY